MATQFEHKDNSGSVFVNDRKTKENHPRPQRQRPGRRRRVLGQWLAKKTKDGKPYLSLSFKPKVVNEAKPEFADEVPF